MTWALKEKLKQVRSSLRLVSRLKTVYDRTELVDQCYPHVQKNLFEGGLPCHCCTFVFLGNLRAGLIVALAIPLSMLFCVFGMLRFGIAGSLLSLGAIDFGLVVDSSWSWSKTACGTYHTADRKRSRLEIIRDAALEVASRPCLAN